MRTRLNGFFDDFNQPMGAFEERNWNQSYSGCMGIGKVSQHINNQFHAHNVIASGYCDRGVASSRVRYPFDFKDRTGVIEFDLDGSQKTREFWYLDLSPFERKRDLTGHTSLGTSNPYVTDPPYLLRIAEIGHNIEVQLADAYGRLYKLPNMHQDGACELLAYCEGQNLNPLINVRRHWRIELSKTHIKIFIEGTKVIDGSLITDYSPQGLEYEKAQVNWLTFSYNTTKENFVLSMIHWDNFGFDAPTDYVQETVVHNYTDGELGTETDRIGNEYSVGKAPRLDDPAIVKIPIPDQIIDVNGDLPVRAELMFTVQGGHYEWSEEEYILFNDKPYSHPEPSSENPMIVASEIVNTIRPYSQIIELNPNDLIQGFNEIKFFMDDARLLNIHIELYYPIDVAPSYTPPKEIYEDHISKLMGFWEPANTVGPGIVFNRINSTPYWTLDSEYEPVPGIDRWYVYDLPVSESISLSVLANSQAQMAATGKATGISYYEIWIDKEVVLTRSVDTESEVAEFKHELTIDISSLEDGIHELFVQAYDVNGKPSHFDAFQAHASPGEYMPTIFEIKNNISTSVSDEIYSSIKVFPNPTSDIIHIEGLEGICEIQIVDIFGKTLKGQQVVSEMGDLNLSDLISGVYFLKVMQEGKDLSSFHKIVKH